VCLATPVAVATRFCRVSGGVPGSLVGGLVVVRRSNRYGSGSVSILFARGSWPEVSRISALLRRETVGGALLLAAASLALVWANSPWSESYAAVRDFQLGPEVLHLRLSVGEWAADGLLAIFFFVAGLELKREFVAGDLRDPRRAALPVAAAIGGMVVPAVIFVLVNLSSGGGALRGWAVPTATDIAFALAVLAIVSTHLPAALRTFLLTLAVVDDLLAITIIAGDVHLQQRTSLRRCSNCRHVIGRSHRQRVRHPHCGVSAAVRRRQQQRHRQIPRNPRIPGVLEPTLDRTAPPHACTSRGG
jgi:Na+/H+ antiporter 1